MKIEDHLAKIEKEVQDIAAEGHLTTDIVMARFVNAIEYEIHEARREVENGRQHNRNVDVQSDNGRGND